MALGQESASDAGRDDWLFIRHTYLITLTALILQRHFGIDVEREAETNPEELLDGSTLDRYSGVRGVIESDLFLWAHGIGETQYVRAIARKVSQFDWTETADELAATLYQNTITQQERKRLGEYYTPRWLAQAIVDELVNDPTETTTMDPSCGSGTFIECIVRKIISAANGLTPSEKLDRLQRNVIGVDTHPVAVQLAKATLGAELPESDNRRARVGEIRYRPSFRRSIWETRCSFDTTGAHYSITGPSPSSHRKSPASQAARCSSGFL